MNDDPTNAQVGELLAKAIARHRDGALTSAEAGYEEVLRRQPEHADARHLLGVIAHQLGNTVLAIERVRESLELEPNQPNALNNLGNMYADAERLEEAIESYRRAIDLKPDYAEAHHNLGNVLADSDRIPEALEYFAKAAELQPEDAASWTAFGIQSEKIGRFEQAIEAYETALAIDEHSVQALSRLGAALRKMDRLVEAKAVYERWLVQQPHNPVPAHFIEACGPSGTAPERASAEYVRTTFDEFAEDFEACLSELDYHVPEKLGQLTRQRLAHAGWADNSVVDLGCGTGWCGDFLRPVAAQLVGVDLSPNMLAKAQTRRTYDQLVEADLLVYLQQCREGHDAIVAADTLIYFGDLRPIFDAAADALRPGGWLVFSLEKRVEGGDRGYRLDRSGRYQHAEGEVRDWLSSAGFTEIEMQETKLRNEGYAEVGGFLIQAQTTASPASQRLLDFE